MIDTTTEKTIIITSALWHCKENEKNTEILANMNAILSSQHNCLIIYGTTETSATIEKREETEPIRLPFVHIHDVYMVLIIAQESYTEQDSDIDRDINRITLECVSHVQCHARCVASVRLVVITTEYKACYFCIFNTFTCSCSQSM